MPIFDYIVSDQRGKKEQGKINASNEQEALEKLKETGKIIISVTKEKESSFGVFGKPSMNMQEKMLFVKNLSTMIKVGVTVTEALEIMIDQTKKTAHKKMFGSMLEMIRNGQTLANSLESYDYIFSKLFINMIATGEKGGNLEKVLEYLDVQLEKEYEIRRKVLSALIYPAMIVCLTIVIGIGIVVFIMPKITDVFSSFDLTLPLPTRVLIGASDFLTKSTLKAILLFSGVIGFFVTIFKLKALKPFWHRVALRVPVIGGILVAANVARFARTFNSLVQSSVPVTEALTTTGEMLDNTMYKKALTETSARVTSGGKVGESLENYPRLFPMLAVKMFFIGERTGSLDTTTEKVAELYEKNVDARTKTLSVLIEPLMLVLMAGLVGGIALSIILPIYQLPNLIGQ